MKRARRYHLLTHRQAAKLALPFGALVTVELYTKQEAMQRGFIGNAAKAVYLNGRKCGENMQLYDDYNLLDVKRGDIAQE